MTFTPPRFSVWRDSPYATTKLRKSPDGWLTSPVEYRSSRWSMQTFPARVVWNSPTAGIRWTVDVAVREDSLVPGACRIVADIPADASGTADHDGTLRQEVEAVAIARTSAIYFADSSGRYRATGFGFAGPNPYGNVITGCASEGRDWRRYVRTVMAGDIEAVEPGIRPSVEPVDYRQVAERYLSGGVAAVRKGLGATTRSGDAASRARTQVQRAATTGWLGDPDGRGRSARRTAGPRLLDAWRAEGGPPDWYSEPH